MREKDTYTKDKRQKKQDIKNLRLCISQKYFNT